MTEVVFPLAGKRVMVAGHKGMAGSSIVRRLGTEDCEILTADREDLDMSRQAEVVPGARLAHWAPSRCALMP